MPDCRLIFDPPGKGAWNMAVDEALLDAVSDSGVPVLRFYQWQPATLSLGYFQPVADRKHHTESLDCPLVRRSSGGGAIVHDHELTYSLIIPSHCLPGDKPGSRLLYDLVHQAFIATMADALPPSEGHLRQVATAMKVARANEPFLCFQRRAIGDVIWCDVATATQPGCNMAGTHKILGSAQRRRDETVLQHGSLLLKRSAAAPQLPGLFDLAGKSVECGQLAVAAANRIAEGLHFRLREDTINTAESNAAHHWQTIRYDNDGYVRRR